MFEGQRPAELDELIDEAFSLHDDIDAATNWVAAHIRNNPAMQNHLMLSGIRHALNDRRSTERKSAPWRRAEGANTTTVPPSVPLDAVLANAEFVNSRTKTILDIYRIGDKPLKECTKEDFDAAIERHEAYRDGHQAKMNFYRRFSNVLEPGQTVQEAGLSATVVNRWHQEDVLGQTD